MQARVDGKPVSTERMMLRSIGFGEPHPTAKHCTYQLELATGEVIKHLAEHYDEAAREDAAEGGTDTEPTSVRLRRLGWPKLNLLVVKHPEAAAAFLERWVYDLVDLLFQGPEGAYRFAINSVERVQLHGAKVTIEGEVLDLEAEEAQP